MDTLADELEFDGTRHIPSDTEIPRDMEWNDGYTELFDKPLFFSSLENVLKVALKNKHGFLRYHGLESVMDMVSEEDLGRNIPILKHRLHLNLVYEIVN